MKKFDFRLERVLEWRRRKLDIEREKQRVLLAELDAIDSGTREREAAALEPADAEMTGNELAARQAFHDRLRREIVQLSHQREDCLKRLAAQVAAVIAADREVKLVVRLREKALGRWQHAADLELEQLAGEAYLAQWAREARSEQG